MPDANVPQSTAIVDRQFVFGPWTETAVPKVPNAAAAGSAGFIEECRAVRGAIEAGS